LALNVSFRAGLGSGTYFSAKAYRTIIIRIKIVNYTHVAAYRLVENRDVLKTLYHMKPIITLTYL